LPLVAHMPTQAGSVKLQNALASTYDYQFGHWVDHCGRYCPR